MAQMNLSIKKNRLRNIVNRLKVGKGEGLGEGGLEIMPPFSGPSLAGLGGEPGWAGPVGKHAKHMLSGHCGLIVQ